MTAPLAAAAFVLLTTLGPLQVRRHVDLNREPWGRVMDMIRAEGDVAAQHELERVGRGGVAGAEREWERAHAFRWAAQLALRGGRLSDARRDCELARAADPSGFDGKMATVHLGEIAIRERRWFEAERYLAQVEHDADPVVAAYARNRITAVRERTRRLALRYASLALIALFVLALGWRTARALRSPASRAAWPRTFGWALLGTEAVLAIGGALVVPRATTMLARSGWMAFAIPAAVALALAWAARDRGPVVWWRRALAVAFVVVALAAGLYVALDLTWWSVEHPIA